jgi:hypothetical protein
MRGTQSGGVVLLWLLSMTAGASELPAPKEAAPSPVPAARGWHALVRMEATTLALLPRENGGMAEGFAQIEPTFILDAGPRLGANLGAPVRLRLWGGDEGASFVRRQDWDSLSDWGQLVRALKLGSDASPVALWVGALEGFHLLSGHLVRRYSNRSNPDYHPAGALLTAKLAPLYMEVFASDVLGARLTGAEVELDVEHVLFGQPREKGRYTLALSAAHDWGRAEGRAPSVTLAHLDATAVVLARRDFELHLLAGWGGRPGEGGAWGAVAGLGVDAVTSRLDVLARLEARRQRGGFRQGFFGPDYELARFRAAGPDGVPLANASFPDGFSVYGEAVVGWDAVWLGEVTRRHLRLSLGAEAFGWGRVDVDGRLSVQLARRHVELAVQGLAVGLGQPGARYLVSGEARWRLIGGGLYVLGQSGTLLFPTGDGALRPGACASVGLGVDHAR